MSKHIEYKKIVEGAKIAVLCIHGILGTPNHFRDLIPLIPENYSVFAMVTDGHCSTVSDFSHSSMDKWEMSVQYAVDELLKTHEDIYIVGHSMGTLFAIEQGIKNPHVKRLFCISVPIKVSFLPGWAIIYAKNDLFPANLSSYEPGILFNNEPLPCTTSSCDIGKIKFSLNA